MHFYQTVRIAMHEAALETPEVTWEAETGEKHSVYVDFVVAAVAAVYFGSSSAAGLRIHLRHCVERCLVAKRHYSAENVGDSEVIRIVGWASRLAIGIANSRDRLLAAGGFAACARIIASGESSGRLARTERGSSDSALEFPGWQWGTA